MIQDPKYNDELIVNYFDLVPFIVDPQEVYTADTLYAGYDMDCPETFKDCYDQKTYNHFMEHGKIPDNDREALSRRLHDFCIMSWMKDLLDCYDPHLVVGVMGGNAMHRDDPDYEKIARISKALTERGYLMVNGGGSGAMEATGFGAWMAGRAELEFQEGLNRLKTVPEQKDLCYINASLSVYKDFPQRDYESLSVPTWLYGHEWTHPFATHIAKMFDNANREDTLLTIANGGVIYAPGRAGTVQEIFQKAVQNHYMTFGSVCPMVFLGENFWTNVLPIYPMLEELIAKTLYRHMPISLSDDIDEVVKVIENFDVSSAV